MPHFVHPWELGVVLVIIVIIFGVGRLPEVGGAMGKAIREFRQSVSGKTPDTEEPQLEAEKTEKS